MVPDWYRIGTQLDLSFYFMAYSKRVKATIHGEIAEKFRKEVQKRGGYHGAEADIVKEALREKLKNKS